MRLINAHDFALKDFSGSRATPPYAILSHTWGEDDTEVTYRDMQDLDKAKHKTGFQKIEWTCRQAREHDLDWAWVDTCCIDKSSSHELSEAINSMYAWYVNAEVCYVFLNDVPSNCPTFHEEDYVPPSHLRFVEAFEESRWFTRGWTLQELIAPKCVLFFGQAWNFIAALEDIIQRVSGITGIQTDVLSHSCALSDLSVARRLSWAAKRNTKRIEDEAYALLGLLNVNMPLLYGEGTGAFLRLQEAIIAKSTDQSIFAWDAPSGFIASRELLLAPSPSCFASASNIRRRRGLVSESAFSLNNNGLDITLPVLRRRLNNDPSSPQVLLAVLDCKYEGTSDALALVLSQHLFNNPGESRAIETYVSGCDNTHQFARLLPVDNAELVKAIPTLLTITKDLRGRNYIQDFSSNHPSWFPIRFTGGDVTFTPRLHDVYPERCWSDASRTARLNTANPLGGIIIDVVQNSDAQVIFSALVIFGLGTAASSRTIYDILRVHRECAIEAHLHILPGGLTNGPERMVARIPFSRERQLVAQLLHNALTVSIESIEERSIASFSPPVSPMLSRASSSFSSRRRDSFLQDGRSDTSGTSQSDALPSIAWTHHCHNCRALRARERADREEQYQARKKKAAKEAAERKQHAKEQSRKKQLKVAKGVGAGLSIGSLLADIGDLDIL